MNINPSFLQGNNLSVTSFDRELLRDTKAAASEFLASFLLFATVRSMHDQGGDKKSVVRLEYLDDLFDVGRLLRV